MKILGKFTSVALACATVAAALSLTAPAADASVYTHTEAAASVYTHTDMVRCYVVETSGDYKACVEIFAIPPTADLRYGSTAKYVAICGLTLSSGSGEQKLTGAESAAETVRPR